MNITKKEALKEISAEAASVGLTFKATNARCNNKQLYKLVIRGSSKALIDNYPLWTAYEDYCSGYLKTLGEPVKEKNFYAYVGQNATTGTAHATTGKFSMYGDIIAFSTIDKRDQFVAEYSDTNNYAEKCNRNTARKYCLGITVENFNDWVIGGADRNVDEHYNSYFGVAA